MLAASVGVSDWAQEVGDKCLLKFIVPRQESRRSAVPTGTEAYVSADTKGGRKSNDC